MYKEKEHSGSKVKTDSGYDDTERLSYSFEFIHTDNERN